MKRVQSGSVKKIHLKEDTVVDEQGRQRFHGAFTGGFSAGYYNTVGSEEGWKPQTFISGKSSSNKTEYKKQSILDFADAEDGLMGGSLGLQDDFTNNRSDKNLKEYGVFEKDAKELLSGRIVKEFLVAANHAIGIQLLQKMGWREGQGVGARVKYEDVHEAVEKSKLPSLAVEGSERIITKAPTDFNITIPLPKADVYGIGYTPSFNNKRHTSSSSRSSTYKMADFMAIKGGPNGDVSGINSIERKGGLDRGFAFNDAEEEEVFGRDHDMFATEEILIESDNEDDNEHDHVSKRLKKNASQWVDSGITAASSASAAAVPRRKCLTDGRLTLNGFTLAEISDNMNNSDVYPPIRIPPNYTPATSLFLPIIETLRKPRQSRWQSVVAPVPATDSVFALLSEETRNKLTRNIASTTAAVAIKTEQTSEELTDTTSAAVGEESYRNILLAENSRKKFSGLSEAFKNRFVTASSASSTALSSQEQGGLKSVSDFATLAREMKGQSEAVLVTGSNLSQTKDVSSSKIIRKTKLWSPHPLLCKRFNVPVPQHVSSSQVGTAVDMQTAQLLGRADELYDKHIGAYVNKEEADVVHHPPDTTQLEMKKIEQQESEGEYSDMLTQVAMSIAIRPEMSLLKSIFDSDSEGSEDSAEEEPEGEKEIGIRRDRGEVKVKVESEEMIGTISSNKIVSKPIAAIPLPDISTSDQPATVAPDTSKIVFKKPVKKVHVADGDILEAAEGNGEVVGKGKKPSKKQQVKALSFSFDD